MKIVPSNSGCCGVKYIRDIPHPERILKAELKDLTQREKGNLESYTTEPDYPYENLFHWEAPEETALNRFDRYLRFLRDTRPEGLVEVYLADNADAYHEGVFVEDSCFDCNCLYPCNGIHAWRDLLLERGFSVTYFTNSNSENPCAVFTLAYGD